MSVISTAMKSPQTGFDITLPGKEVAQIRVDSLFGDTDVSEGASATIVSGSLQGHPLDQLTVREKGAL